MVLFLFKFYDINYPTVYLLIMYYYYIYDIDNTIIYR